MGRFLDVTNVPVAINASPNDAPELNSLYTSLSLERIHSSPPHAAQPRLGGRMRVVLVALEGPLVPGHYIMRWIWWT